MNATPLVASLVLLAALAPATQVAAQVAYVDSQGREWRELSVSTARTWLAVASVCPTDGTTPCTGSLGNLSVDGWVWATQEQVQELLAEFAPVVANGGCFWGSLYNNDASLVLASFDSIPTFELTNHVQGLTATSAVGAGLKNYAYAPRIGTHDEILSDSGICLTDMQPKNYASSSSGIWMFRPVCQADLDNDGTVGPSDLAVLLNAWGGSGAGDLNGSGTVDGQDLPILLAAWGGC